MFKYRTVLIDEARKQERPVQAHFNFYSQATEWISTILAGASENAYVEIYTAIETKSGIIKKSDLPLEKHDQIAVPGVQPAKT